MDVRGGRERLGLSQSDLARRSGLDQSLVSKFERGEREPNAAQAALLAMVLADSGEAADPTSSGRKLDTYPSAPTEPGPRRAWFDARNAAIARGVPLPSSGVFGRPPKVG